MRRTSKKLGALLISMLLILSLVACGSMGEIKDNSAGGEATTGQQEAAPETTTSQNDAQSEQEQQVDSAPIDPSTETTKESDILVVYFSRTGEQYTVGVIDEGNTAIVAKMIAEQTGADQFEVLPVDDHYPMTYSER